MKDMSPDSLLDLAKRFHEDGELAGLWDACSSGRVNEPVYQHKKQRPYCGFITSEGWESNECGQTGGEYRSGYGMAPAIYAWGEGLNLGALKDFVIKYWIKAVNE